MLSRNVCSMMFLMVATNVAAMSSSTCTHFQAALQPICLIAFVMALLFVPLNVCKDCMLV